MVKIKDKEDREKFYLVFLQKKLAWDHLMIGKSFSISSFSNWTKVFYDQKINRTFIRQDSSSYPHHPDLGRKLPV